MRSRGGAPRRRAGRVASQLGLGADAPGSAVERAQRDLEHAMVRLTDAVDVTRGGVVHGWGVVARVALGPAECKGAEALWDPLARYVNAAAPPAAVADETVVACGARQGATHFDLNESVIYCVNEAPTHRARVADAKRAACCEVAAKARALAARARDAGARDPTGRDAVAELELAAQRQDEIAERHARDAETMRAQAAGLAGGGHANCEFKIRDTQCALYKRRLGISITAFVPAGTELLAIYNRNFAVLRVLIAILRSPTSRDTSIAAAPSPRRHHHRCRHPASEVSHAPSHALLAPLPLPKTSTRARPRRCSRARGRFPPLHGGESDSDGDGELQVAPPAAAAAHVAAVSTESDSDVDDGLRVAAPAAAKRRRRLTRTAIPRTAPASTTKARATRRGGPRSRRRSSRLLRLALKR